MWITYVLLLKSLKQELSPRNVANYWRVLQMQRLEFVFTVQRM